MGKKYNTDIILEKIKSLPREKDILKVEAELDIVVHEFLDDYENHKGTICDIKDLPEHTIYRIRYVDGVYTIEVVINSPKSTMLQETASTLEEAIKLVMNEINKQ